MGAQEDYEAEENKKMMVQKQKAAAALYWLLTEKNHITCEISLFLNKLIIMELLSLHQVFSIELIVDEIEIFKYMKISYDFII